jgi:hypothetical protein
MMEGGGGIMEGRDVTVDVGAGGALGVARVAIEQGEDDAVADGAHHGVETDGGILAAGGPDVAAGVVQREGLRLAAALARREAVAGEDGLHHQGRVLRLVARGDVDGVQPMSVGTLNLARIGTDAPAHVLDARGGAELGERGALEVNKVLSRGQDLEKRAYDAQHNGGAREDAPGCGARARPLRARVANGSVEACFRILGCGHHLPLIWAWPTARRKAARASQEVAFKLRKVRTCRRIWSSYDDVVESNFVEDEKDREDEDECVEGIPGLSQGSDRAVGNEADDELHGEKEEHDRLRRDSYNNLLKATA